jgi:ADP-ribose pyrophosphatase YjhB (NUDIX family)
MQKKWLKWAQKIQAEAQNGLQYSKDKYDRIRYEVFRKIAAEIFAEHTNSDSEKLVQLFTEQTGHATPKVDVRGAVFRDDKILLVREISDGKWTLPGGWADVLDSPAEAVEREISEESGYQARAVKLAALYDRNKHPHPPHPFHTYKMFFICELLGGEARHSIETDGVDFFGENHLPELSISRVLPEQIKRMFAHYRDLRLATEFD